VSIKSEGGNDGNDLFLIIDTKESNHISYVAKFISIINLVSIIFIDKSTNSDVSISLNTIFKIIKDNANNTLFQENLLIKKNITGINDDDVEELEFGLLEFGFDLLVSLSESVSLDVSISDCDLLSGSVEFTYSSISLSISELLSCELFGTCKLGVDVPTNSCSLK
jgi:hypothetical protein